METTLSKSKDECRQINHNPENLPYNQSGFLQRLYICLESSTKLAVQGCQRITKRPESATFKLLSKNFTYNWPISQSPITTNTTMVLQTPKPGKDYIDHSTIYFRVLIITLISTVYLSLHFCDVISDVITRPW